MNCPKCGAKSTGTQIGLCVEFECNSVLIKNGNKTIQSNKCAFAELAKMKSDLKEAVDALRPFGDSSKYYLGPDSIGLFARLSIGYHDTTLTLGQLRTAKRIVEKHEKGEGK